MTLTLNLGARKEIRYQLSSFLLVHCFANAPYDDHTRPVLYFNARPLPPELEQYLIEEAQQQGLLVEAMTLRLLAKSIAAEQQQAEAADLLQSWIDDEDIEDQQTTGQYLLQALDEDRLSNRQLFPPALKEITW